eukprot:6985677-Prymnesium_polylepis.2
MLLPPKLHDTPSRRLQSITPSNTSSVTRPSGPREAAFGTLKRQNALPSSVSVISVASQKMAQVVSKNKSAKTCSGLRANEAAFVQPRRRLSES